jgi:beta-lactamase superfamily II metal-dependent hydrolase
VKFRSANYRDTVAAFENGSGPQGSRHKILNYGDTVSNWRVLFPDSTNVISKADDSPLVLLGNFSGTRILLLSDLSRAGQSQLLSLTNDLHADIVVAGLPSEGEPLGDALIAAIQPRMIVIADSEFPATRRASRPLKERLSQTKIPVIYTRTAGAVKIVIDKAAWRLNTMDGQKFNSAASSY